MRMFWSDRTCGTTPGFATTSQPPPRCRSADQARFAGTREWCSPAPWRAARRPRAHRSGRRRESRRGTPGRTSEQGLSPKQPCRGFSTNRRTGQPLHHWSWREAGDAGLNKIGGVATPPGCRAAEAHRLTSATPRRSARSSAAAEAESRRRRRYWLAVWTRNCLARASTLFSISPTVTGLTSASVQRPSWNTWRNTVTRIASERSSRPRM